MQNSAAKMTPELYFEMCEALGSQPIDSEIPVELGDLPAEIQDIFELYRQLEDKYSDFSGQYLGKSYIGFAPLHEIFCPDLDKIFCLRILRYIDSLKIENMSAMAAQKASLKDKKTPKAGE